VIQGLKNKKDKSALLVLFYYFYYFCLSRPLSISTPTTLRATFAGKSRVCALCAGTMWLPKQKRDKNIDELQRLGLVFTIFWRYINLYVESYTVIYAANSRTYYY